MFVLRVMLACLAMSVILLWGRGNIGTWQQWSVGERIVQTAFWVGSGVLVYFAVLWMLGLRPSQFRSSASFGGDE